MDIPGSAWFNIYVSNHEHRHDNDPKQRLISLLQADFTPPDTQALAREAGDNALKDLLANVRSVDDIDARYASEENTELGEAVERLVEPAPVTASFKGFIAHKVREAHAWRSKVDDIVSPARLGLLSGEGIFDAGRGRDIEAQALRGYAFDIMHRYTTTFAIEGEGATAPGQLFLTGIAKPGDYRKAVDIFDEWTDDYQQTYDEDPFEGLEEEAFLDAGGRLVVPEGSGMAGLIRRLRQLRDEGDQE